MALSNHKPTNLASPIPPALLGQAPRAGAFGRPDCEEAEGLVRSWLELEGADLEAYMADSCQRAYDFTVDRSLEIGAVAQALLKAGKLSSKQVRAEIARYEEVPLA